MGCGGVRGDVCEHDAPIVRLPLTSKAAEAAYFVEYLTEELERADRPLEDILLACEVARIRELTDRLVTCPEDPAEQTELVETLRPEVERIQQLRQDQQCFEPPGSTPS
ncbi:hypothetical protein DIPPA_52984 [Diplonema papillatum]|nr:hypothetical protein DIPPA_52984 [Diplonema papillatum]